MKIKERLATIGLKMKIDKENKCLQISHLGSNDICVFVQTDITFLEDYESEDEEDNHIIVSPGEHSKTIFTKRDPSYSYAPTSTFIKNDHRSVARHDILEIEDDLK